MVDGDTLRCANVEEANGRVRLARIDAPERGEPGHQEASDALAALINGREVMCQQVDATPRLAGFQEHDRYGRVVAFCRVGSVDLGSAQVDRGLAVKW